MSPENMPIKPVDANIPKPEDVITGQEQAETNEKNTDQSTLVQNPEPMSDLVKAKKENERLLEISKIKESLGMNPGPEKSLVGPTQKKMSREEGHEEAESERQQKSKEHFEKDDSNEIKNSLNHLVGSLDELQGIITRNEFSPVYFDIDELNSIRSKEIIKSADLSEFLQILTQAFSIKVRTANDREGSPAESRIHQLRNVGEQIDTVGRHLLSLKLKLGKAKSLHYQELADVANSTLRAVRRKKDAFDEAREASERYLYR